MKKVMVGTGLIFFAAVGTVLARNWQRGNAAAVGPTSNAQAECSGSTSLKQSTEEFIG